MISNFIKQIPENIKPFQVLSLAKHTKTNLLSEFKSTSKLPNDKISYCLEISINSYRMYLKRPELINIRTKEHILLLISLFKKGNRVLGSNNNFKDWLDKENLFFDNSKPISYLQFISGIRFIDDRLVAMEYGDNV